jgi:membrane-bound lytic murein transglycosylase D
VTDNDKTIIEPQQDMNDTGRAPPVQLMLLQPDGERRVLTLTGTAVIGRDPGSTVCLPDVLVSRRHAELYPAGSRWHIRDLGSSNGTYLNGHRITDVELPPQATLQFGAEGPQLWLRQAATVTGQPAVPAGAVTGNPQPAATPGSVPAGSCVPPLTVTIRMASGKSYSRPFRNNVTIGSDSHCTVRLDHQSVGPVHAELFHDGTAWCVRDLGSATGTLLNGQFVTQARIVGAAELRIGHDGPVLRLEPESTEPTTASSGQPASPAGKSVPKSLDEVARHYFEDRPDHEAGEHTIMVRRAFQQVKKQQKRRYYGIISVVVLLLAVSVGVGVYQYLKLQRAERVAVNIFYNMKTVGLEVSRIESLVKDTGNKTYQGQVSARRRQLQDMEKQYDRYLEETGALKKDLSQQDRLIIRMARVFGECELNMPEGFRREVKRYIARWQQTGRLTTAIKTLQKNDYAQVIYKDMVDNNMPPQFLYLALQESSFNRRAVGPETRFGYAKGMWQFIPGTARKYGLRTGPLVELPRFDPRDERFNFDRATDAAARYIRDLYNTDAEASGLLVMASYNWGFNNVRKLINNMPDNPRERNFWKLLEQHKIPKETYDYVFYIFSASVIGENPRLFGFDFDNPLAGLADAG